MKNTTKFYAALERAFTGDKDAAQVFFEEFLTIPLFVPERYQAQPLSDAPDYPNDFMNLLGLKDGDRAVIPIFTEVEFINDWCGAELVHKELTAEKLMELVPEGWWIDLNLGTEIVKEFSPWEIDQLRGGAENIPALIDELFPSEALETLEIRPPKEGEYEALQKALIEAAPKNELISQIFLLREEGIDENEDRLNTVLIGIEADCRSNQEVEDLREEIRLIAEPAQIGGDPIKILAGDNVENSLMLGVFKGAKPIYER